MALSESVAPRQTETLRVRSDVLKASAVSVSVGDTTILEEVSLRVESGRSLAVVGPSGSGKSTLLNCLTGIIVPDAGTVTIDGHELSSLSESKRAAFRLRSIGVVGQDPHLLDELDVADNAALAQILMGGPRPEARRRAIEMLSQLGLAGRSSARVQEISGGEAQRVAIARALVKLGVTVVVADEPTASLDQRNVRHVMEALLGLCRSHDVPLVVATHDPAVWNMCDEAIDLRA